MLRNNKLLINAYQNYIKEIKLNKQIKSISLNRNEIKRLENKKYNLYYFDIYKYIKLSDFLWSKGNFNIDLSCGIKLNWNKFKNILVDSYYQDIPNEMFYEISISTLFQFYYKDNLPININLNVTELSELDLEFLRINFIKNNYNYYFGNYNTYYTFK